MDNIIGAAATSGLGTAGAVLAFVVVALLLVVVIFKAMWRVAEPNEALVISGLKHTPEGAGEGFGFKIVVGKGVLVLPGVQAVRRLSLDLREADLQVDCVTKQGIPLQVRGVVIFKVGDDYTSIANAARRFLDQQNMMDQRVHNVFAGHLRSIVGSLTVEEMIRDRSRLTQETRDSSAVEMEKLGLIIDSLQIQEIDDPTGYIGNLSKPHAAAVSSQARIAQADADREATQREQEAEALKAQARRDSEIKQASYQADIDKASAEAAQSGPLADAAARQQVVVQETKVAEFEAQREEQRLQATVRKPADAQAYQQVTLSNAEKDARIAQAEAKKRETELAAEADAQRVKLTAGAEAERVKITADAEAHRVRLTADANATATRQTGEAEAAATQARGLAEGRAVEARGLAEAKSIEARAAALAQNQEAVIGQQIAENYDKIVAAAAGAFQGVNNMTVLNGADGVTEALSSLIGNAGAGLAAVRTMLSHSDDATHANANGSAMANGRPVAAIPRSAAETHLSGGGRIASETPEP